MASKDEFIGQLFDAFKRNDHSDGSIAALEESFKDAFNVKDDNDTENRRVEEESHDLDPGAGTFTEDNPRDHTRVAGATAKDRESNPDKVGGNKK